MIRRVVRCLSIALTFSACHDISSPKQREPVLSLSPVANVTITDLGSLGGDEVIALAINRGGTIVGQSSVVPGQSFPFHPFLWTADDGMRDLGTFGGSDGRAWDINDRGQVVGEANLPSGQRRPFLWTEAGGLRDLGTLGGSTGIALGINAAGQVVGEAQTALGDGRAFLWVADEELRDLGTLGGRSSTATDVNVFGQVVGQSAPDPAGPSFEAMVWTETRGMVGLGNLGGALSGASAINDLGEIAGFGTTSPDQGQLERQAFLWTQTAGFIMLDPLSDDLFSNASDINNAGFIVGASFNDALGDARAVLWTVGGGVVELQGFGGPLGGAGAITEITGNRAYVVGFSTLPGGGLRSLRAVVWTLAIAPALPLDVVRRVETLVANAVLQGSLAQGPANALAATLAAARRLLDLGLSAAAVRVLEAFSRQVDAFVKADLLSSEAGRVLKDLVAVATGELSECTGPWAGAVPVRTATWPEALTSE